MISRSCKLMVLITVFTVLIVGAVLISESFVSFETARATVQAWKLSSDPIGGQLTRAGYERIIASARVLGLILLLTAAGVYCRRRRAEALLELFANETRLLAAQWNARLLAFAKEDRWHLLTLLLLWATGVTLRLAYLFQPMQYDEAFTFDYYASKPLYVALSVYFSPNNHLFHTLLVFVAHRILGNHPWALRLPALVAGLLLMPVAYAAVRSLYGKHAALLAAALIAPSALLIEYSTNARGYSILTLCFMASLWLAAELLRQEHPMEWVLFVLAGTLGFFTIPVMLYPFGVVVGWMFVSGFTRHRSAAGRFTRKILLASAITLVLAGLLYVPVLVVSGPRALFANRVIVSQPWAEFTASLPGSLLTVAQTWHANLPAPLAVIVVTGMLLALLFHQRISPTPIPVPVVGIIWLASLLLAQRVVPPPRVWIFLLPLYLGVSSAGLALLAKWGARRIRVSEFAAVPVIALLLSATATIGLITSRCLDEWNATVGIGPAEQWLETELRAGDRIFAPGPADAVVEYYLRKNGVPDSYLFTPLATSRRMILLIPLVRRMDATLSASGSSTQGVVWEWHGATDAASVSGWLQDRLRPGDKVLAAAPLSLGLSLYFRKNGISDGFAFATRAPSRRLILLVPGLEIKSETDQVREFELGPAKLMKRFAKVTVYECQVGGARPRDALN